MGGREGHLVALSARPPSSTLSPRLGRSDHTGPGRVPLEAPPEVASRVAWKGQGRQALSPGAIVAAPSPAAAHRGSVARAFLPTALSPRTRTLHSPSPSSFPMHELL